ncbi:hypothetical protein MMC28_000929 [Mycoblastus sanguinarius]|nr:hypothetical protein [Mycoblastus sanguinarius]
MASRSTHEERTAAERREPGMHRVTLHKIEQVSETVRLLQLRLPPANKEMKACQWLDVHIPGLPQAGGFTITSMPKDATPLRRRKPSYAYLELAVQKSPQNPPAAWLWQPIKKILGDELLVRAGGSLVWPPPDIDLESITNLVFIAGGVGIK